MKKLLLFSFILFSINTYAQKEETIFIELAPGHTNTLTINTESYSQNTLSALKDGLLSFNEKIEKVKYNEAPSYFIFTYNNGMSK
ncbi:MAG: hypothetical protein P8Q14_10095, partial [Vicingaceae bacterium]|nr:hypothetical protein [Vicingaceae bacterium]